MLYTVLRFEAEGLDSMEKRSKGDNCGGGIQKPAGEFFLTTKRSAQKVAV